jgi:hypothetical protein
MSFTLLWQKILRSSLWVQESKETRIVWIALLALKDKDGVIQSSLIGLADAAKVTVEECSAALETLMSPDLNDTSGVEEGRRIRKVQGGWQIINNDLYRFSTEAKREFWRQSQQDYRQERRKQAAPEPPNKPEEEAKPPRERFIKPTMEEVNLAAAKIGLSKLETNKFFSYYEANGWRVGKNPMKNWSHALSGWKMRSKEYGGSQNSGGSGKPNPRNFGVHANTDYSKPAIPKLQRELEEKARLAAELSANGGGSPGADQGDGSSV